MNLQDNSQQSSIRKTAGHGINLLLLMEKPQQSFWRPRAMALDVALDGGAALRSVDDATMRFFIFQFHYCRMNSPDAAAH